MNKILFNQYVLSLVCFGLLSSCGPQSEKSLLQEAQLCLNEAPADQARNCVSKISSISTASAYKLRCSAIFISEGFGGAAELVQNLDLIESGGSCTNCSTMVPLMTVFSFNKGDNSQLAARTANIATSEEAIAECTQAGSKGYYQVSQLFKMGTLTQMKAYESGVNPNSTPTEAELQTAIDLLTDEDLGDIAISTYQYTCNQTSNPSDTMKSICQDFSEAIGNNITDPQAVGECLKIKLKNINGSC